MFSLPVIAEVVMFFNISAVGFGVGVAGDGVGTVEAGRPGVDVRPGGGMPILIFQVFTGDFDALATGLAVGGLLAWARRKPAGRRADRPGSGRQTIRCCCCCRWWCWPADRPRRRCRADCGGDRRRLVPGEPAVMMLFPPRWSEFFRLNSRRGDDMDSIYNVVKSFTGWRGFDQNLGFWQPPAVS